MAVNWGTGGTTTLPQDGKLQVKTGDINNPWITQNNVTRGAPSEENNDETL